MKSDKRKRRKKTTGNAFAFLALSVFQAALRANNFTPPPPPGPIIEDIPHEDVTEQKKLN